MSETSPRDENNNFQNPRNQFLDQIRIQQEKNKNIKIKWDNKILTTNY